MRTLFCVLVGACVFVGSGAASTPINATTCQDYPLDITAACQAYHGAAAQVKQPAIPTSNSKTLAKAAFTGDYNTVWNYLSPQYQAAVSHSHWVSCQKQNPVAPPGVVVTKISIAEAGDVPMSLPKFGTQQVYEVQMQVLFTRSGAQSVALVYAYWFHTSTGKWVTVWLPSVYSKYKSGACDLKGLTRGLY